MSTQTDITAASGGNRHAVSAGAGKPSARKSHPVRRKKERAADPERDGRTVFIGNLPVEYTNRQLTRLCSEFGIVSTVRFRSVAVLHPEKSKKIAVFKKEFSSEHPVKNAYVVFCEQEGAEKALALHNRVIDGRHVKVDLSSNKGHDYKASVFVGNLPRKTEDESVRSFFESSCGAVDSVRLIRDGSGVGKGFGYVKFADTASVVLALKCHKTEFQGRQIRVFKAKKNPGGSVSAGPRETAPRSFSGQYAKKGETSTKTFQPRLAGKGKGKKPSQKSKEVKNYKKEKRMQSIDKRKTGKAQKKSKRP